MGEWSGYCSHEPGIDCPNCKTYYLVPGTTWTPRLNYAHILLFESWLGRTPATKDEVEEVNGLRNLLRLWKQQITTGRGASLSGD